MMAGRRVLPERERMLLELIASGMSPNRAARVSGVSVTFAYGLDRKVNGVPRLAAKREAMAARAAERAVRGNRRRVRPERERKLLELIASGMSPNRAAGVAGVSVTFAYGLYHKIGGVCRPPGTTYCDRYLDRDPRDG